MRLRMQVKLLVLCTGALTLAGCMTSSPVTVQGVRSVVGGILPGTMGKTLQDQNRIDETVARGCGGGVFMSTECQRHTEASAVRRKELRE